MKKLTAFWFGTLRPALPTVAFYTGIWLHIFNLSGLMAAYSHTTGNGFTAFLLAITNTEREPSFFMTALHMAVYSGMIYWGCQERDKQDLKRFWSRIRRRHFTKGSRCKNLHEIMQQAKSVNA